MDIDEILLSRPVNKLVLERLNVDARSHGVMDFESLGGLVLVKDELPKVPRPQIGNDENKDIHQRLQVDRKRVRKVYAAQIQVTTALKSDQLFNSNKLVEHSTNFSRIFFGPGRNCNIRKYCWCRRGIIIVYL